MTLIEHLEELRRRLIKSMVAVGAGAAFGWFGYNWILALLTAPLKRIPAASQILKNGKLITTSPPEAFFIRVKVSLFAGVVLALPVILWQLWRFIAPGLYGHEKRYAVPFVAAAMALFAFGAAVAVVSLPQALRFLVDFAGNRVVLLPRASEYLSFILLMIVAFAVAFEFPLVLLALALVGVVSSTSLRKRRRIAWFLILVVAALITPTQDPVTQLLLAIPMAVLYEATIVVARLLKR